MGESFVFITLKVYLCGCIVELKFHLIKEHRKDYFKCYLGGYITKSHYKCFMAIYYLSSIFSVISFRYTILLEPEIRRDARLHLLV